MRSAVVGSGSPAASPMTPRHQRDSIGHCRLTRIRETRNDENPSVAASAALDRLEVTDRLEYRGCLGHEVIVRTGGMLTVDGPSGRRLRAKGLPWVRLTSGFQCDIDRRTGLAVLTRC